MLIDYDKFAKDVIGCKVPKPVSGTLSGHAAGEPFDKYVYSCLKESYPNNVYRNYEYLNKMFLENPQARTYDQRTALFHSDLAAFLLQRGKEAVNNWTPQRQFAEKQNDTADILFVDNNRYDIVDVKTRNTSINGQAPNIISAFKLANAMKLMIDTNAFNDIDIIYVEVDWCLDGQFLVAKNVHVADLFKANPMQLYINWAAAMQIQFHVSDLNQSFTGTREEWAHQYLTTYYLQALRRAENMKLKFADPFKQYTYNFEKV